jgi:hypothetical protein
MRFWPFGKDKDEDGVEFVSRVIASNAQDGVKVRGKVTVAFREPLSPELADPIGEDAGNALRLSIAATDEGSSLVGQELSLARDVAARMKARAEVRAVEVVAVHVVGSAQTPSPGEVSSRPPPAGVSAPPSRPPAAAPLSRPAPASQPPPARPASRPAPPAQPPSAEPPVSRHPPSAAQGSGADSRPPTAPPRRSSSSQMLAVRDSRLIPEGASVAVAAHALVPLLRDAATRVLIGALRACDLVIFRGVRLDKSASDDLADLVPLSTAAPGRFADERRSELSRWDERLGKEKLDALRTEASAIVCYFLHTSLGQNGVEMKTSTALLEEAARRAFPEEGPLASLPHYLGSSQDPTDALASKVLSLLEEAGDALSSLTVMLAPVLASLQEDFAFTSRQIKISGVGEE